MMDAADNVMTAGLERDAIALNHAVEPVRRLSIEKAGLFQHIWSRS